MACGDGGVGAAVVVVVLVVAVVDGKVMTGGRWSDKVVLVIGSVVARKVFRSSELHAASRTTSASTVRRWVRTMRVRVYERPAALARHARLAP